jgi:raffinose/stachyose/melibiose transport system substrate-binding protein
MRIKRRAGAVLALVATTALIASGCSKGDSNNQPTSDLYKNPVTLNWWHNANTAGPLQTHWQKVADDFHALHPTVTIKITAIETNDLQRNRIPAALLSGNPPEIFQAWGGGEIQEQVKADYLMDITEQTKAEVANIGPASSIWSVDGKQYGLPFSFGVEGFWYNKDIFTKAGIAAPPKTLDELNDAVTKLKAAKVIPISVGAGDKWPAAHWWYNFAVRECSDDALAEGVEGAELRRPVLRQGGHGPAGVPRDPAVPEDFLAPLVRTVRAARPGWSRMARRDGAHGSLGRRRYAVADAGPEAPDVPRLVPVPVGRRRGGNQTAMMGGGDGFACSKKAPAECVEFLKYIVSPDVEKAFAATGSGIPTAKGAEAGLTDPVLQTIAQNTQSAGAIQLWLDTQFGA